MVKIGTTHHILARLSAAVAGVSVIVAGISKLAGVNLGITLGSYLTFTTIALLFAIYFVVEGWADAAKKDK